MRTGKLAELICASGWNLLYTVPTGENGVVSINLSTTDGTSLVLQLRHVKAGNAGAIAHAPINSIITPYLIGTDNVVVKDFGIGSRDDIWVHASVGSILIASVNSEGIANLPPEPRGR